MCSLVVLDRVDVGWVLEAPRVADYGELVLMSGILWEEQISYDKMLMAREALERAEEQYFNAVKRTLSSPTISNRYKKDLRVRFERLEFKLIDKNKWGYFL